MGLSEKVDVRRKKKKFMLTYKFLAYMVDDGGKIHCNQKITFGIRQDVTSQDISLTIPICKVKVLISTFWGWYDMKRLALSRHNT